MRLVKPALVACAVLACAAPARAQVSWGAGAIPMVSYANRVPGDSTLTEFVLSQPVAWVNASGAGGRLWVHAMLNAEGLTMRDGQLATGVWGEGYIDRRHPHTWGHEIMAGVRDLAKLPLGVSWSVSAGKGFAPFGTDDPMNRPAILFPVNHHLAQIPERALVVLGLGVPFLTLEAGTFNGDEPERPGQWPEWSRFGDSFSGRLLLRPLGGVELQASLARVQSPEHRLGSGLDHDMHSISARLTRPLGGGELYVLVEQEHTSEQGVFHYYSGLVEAQLTTGRHRPYLRLERTDRPEEPRLFGDPFRSVRPHNENANLGITRWITVLAGWGVLLTPPGAPIRAEAVLEAARAHVTVVTGVALSPEGFYGRNDLVLLSVGLRIGAGQRMHRMGRYGVATRTGAGDHHHGS